MSRYVYPKVLYVGSDNFVLVQKLMEDGFPISRVPNKETALEALERAVKEGRGLPDILVCDAGTENKDQFSQLVLAVKGDVQWAGISIIVIANYPSPELRRRAVKLKVSDYYEYPLVLEEFKARLVDLKNGSGMDIKQKPAAETFYSLKIPLWKRLFDILVSSILISLLSPIMLTIALLIRMESRGPIFYISKRAGYGFRVFDFYKFRSMRVDADKLLDKLKDKNQYAARQEAEPEPEPVERNLGDVILVSDESVVDEASYLKKKTQDQQGAFVKIENDPRVTRVGRFIRKTSIDELPQLFNVLKGDMSIVGNRPLPLYEAEKLTSDEWALRFMAPAGITGLWQVEERGEEEVSTDSRKSLDIEYALKFSLWMDLKILLKTLPAVIQKANV